MTSNVVDLDYQNRAIFLQSEGNIICATFFHDLFNLDKQLAHCYSYSTYRYKYIHAQSVGCAFHLYLVVASCV